MKKFLIILLVLFVLLAAAVGAGAVMVQRAGGMEKFSAQFPGPEGRSIGTPDDVRTHLRRMEEVGVDQVVFIQQAGRNRHEHICESMSLFAREVMPEFAARRAAREAKKAAELAPYVEAALRRKQWLAPLAEGEIPSVKAYGRPDAQAALSAATR